MERQAGYTNQRDYGKHSLHGDFGLMDYNARFYSPCLGRFTQADSIVPDAGNPQAWNRYSYVLNSPLMYIDPSGHCSILAFIKGLCKFGDNSNALTT